MKEHYNFRSAVMISEQVRDLKFHLKKFREEKKPERVMDFFIEAFGTFPPAKRDSHPGKEALLVAFGYLCGVGYDISFKTGWNGEIQVFVTNEKSTYCSHWDPNAEWKTIAPGCFGKEEKAAWHSIMAKYHPVREKKTA